MNVTWSYRKKQDTNNKQDNHRELHSNKANEEKESERETKGTKHSQQTVKANLFQTYHFTFQSQQIIVSWYHLHTQKTHIHLNLSSQPFSSVHSSRWLCPVGTAVFVLSSHIPWPSTDASSSSSTSSMCSQYSFVLYFLLVHLCVAETLLSSVLRTLCLRLCSVLRVESKLPTRSKMIFCHKRNGDTKQ